MVSDFKPDDEVIILEGLDISFGKYVSSIINDPNSCDCHRIKIGSKMIFFEVEDVFHVEDKNEVIDLLNDRMTEKIRRHSTDLNTYMNSIENLVGE